MEQVDCVVIGAGVVGLAIARALALGGREVLVLEAEGAIGTQTSARNSEVIHAGIYYPTGSLKASLCLQGRELLYDYLGRHGLPHRRCGKLIVATHARQTETLAQLQAQARANGVDDLVWLTREEARALEPQLSCHAALLSPSTGILDSHALMLALQGDLERAGGLVALKSPVAGATAGPDAIVLEMQDGMRLAARSVVNAAGLGAAGLARRFAGTDTRQLPSPAWAKGNYFTLAGRAPFARLVYPVPEAAGLGVHLTLDLGGQARFGPDVQWVEQPHDLTVDARRGDAFYAEVRKYWPALPDGALQPGYAGIRPKLRGAQGLLADFQVLGPDAHGTPGLVHLLGIESPGLTSALALGEHVARLLQS
ncbi:NAD(P)/FAD-dependent oxidoreductase [Melaminivora sp.]|uniref:NAD(P)/FAD-dependent oxidoreductase n=1 Tax=Melaminivora sp. TaxID=1933032 RepID=UPI0028A77497|nr:NAD(P)/FAD-dependent oxidoreductase [Melaminivora sp.]